MTSVSKSIGLELSDKLYDAFKFFVQIVLPALAVLYASLSEFWGFPRVQEIVGTIGAVSLFLGVIMRISSENHYEKTEGVKESTPVGTFVISEGEDGKKTITLNLNQDPADFIGRDDLTFSVEAGENL